MNMEANATEQDPNKNVIDMLTWMQKFNTATTKSIKYDDYIDIDQFTSDRTKHLLTTTNEKREALVQVLSSKEFSADHRNIIHTTESLIPFLLTIIESLTAYTTASNDDENQTSKMIKSSSFYSFSSSFSLTSSTTGSILSKSSATVTKAPGGGNIIIPMKKSGKSIKYQWTSSINKRKSGWFNDNSFSFDAANVLTTRSIAHFNNACDIVHNSLSSPQGLKISDVTQELRTATGINHFIASKLLSKWNPSKKSTIPLELVPGMLDVLSSLFLATAQRLAIAKAILAQSPPLLIAKLLIGCISKYDNAIKLLRSLKRKDFQLVDDKVRDELGTMPMILRAYACKYLAFSAHNCEEYGKAAAFMQQAVKRFDEMVMGISLQSLSPSLANELKQCKTLLATYVEECKNVYFVTIPSANTLEFPDGSFVIKPLEYNPSLLPLVSFECFQSSTSASHNNLVQDPNARNGWWFMKYFTSRKNKHDGSTENSNVNAQVSASVVLPNYIDKDAFNELPHDVQKELIRQFSSQSLISPSSPSI